MKISKFDSTKYFREFTTRSSQWKGASGIWDIEFMRDGGAIELLASYYMAKLGAFIKVKPMDDAANQIEDITTYIEEARIRAGAKSEYREALFVRYQGVKSYENGHAIPIIYIKANGKEALFLANSLGARYNDHTWLFKSSSIPVYAIEGWRQAADTGCAIDAFAFIQNALGKNEDVYKIPDLLTWLETNCKDASQGVYIYKEVTKLQPRLLKTAQRSDFVPRYLGSSDNDTIVNKKGETIAQHFSRHKKTANNDRALPSYVAQKGMKYRGLVEIEFYLQQLKTQEWFDAKQRKNFIEGAKRHLKPEAAPSNEHSSLLYDYVCRCVNDKYCKIDPWPTLEQHNSSNHNLLYTTAACSLSLMALGVLLAHLFKISPNISALRKMVSCFTASEETSAIITNAATCLIIGAVSSFVIDKARSR